MFFYEFDETAERERLDKAGLIDDPYVTQEQGIHSVDWQDCINGWVSNMLVYQSCIHRRPNTLLLLLNTRRGSQVLRLSPGLLPKWNLRHHNMWALHLYGWSRTSLFTYNQS